MISKINLFTGIPIPSVDEWSQTLIATGGCRIERIVSKGHVSAPGFWYDQAWDEWVALLQGQAVLTIDGQQHRIELSVGDCLLIPAHTRHRVEWTDPAVETIWLAVHLTQPTQ